MDVSFYSGNWISGTFISFEFVIIFAGGTADSVIMYFMYMISRFDIAGIGSISSRLF